MFARFDESPAMTLQNIKETKRYGQTDAHTNVKTVYPPQTKFAGGIKIEFSALLEGGVLPLKIIDQIFHSYHRYSSIIPTVFIVFFDDLIGPCEIK